MPTILWTIGHSTRGWPEFVELLKAHGVRALVDVRHFPSSRRFPQFNKALMADALAAEGIEYIHEVDLGGRRKPQSNSPNTYWRHPQFRAYADYLATPAYRGALERLMTIARRQPTAIMCAEAVPWRCHRQLIADSLGLCGFEVRHILTPTRADIHVLNSAIRIGENGQPYYPAIDSLPLYPAGGEPLSDESIKTSRD
ncbi:MAG TPA: DUF488 domain-containing protein [Pirellulales bacterium]|nr:DUF488 domain-containing protein [Pirellulales bacterium]